MIMESEARSVETTSSITEEIEQSLTTEEREAVRLAVLRGLGPRTTEADVNLGLAWAQMTRLREAALERIIRGESFVCGIADGRCDMRFAASPSALDQGPPEPGRIGSRRSLLTRAEIRAIRRAVKQGMRQPSEADLEQAIKWAVLTRVRAFNLGTHLGGLPEYLGNR